MAMSVMYTTVNGMLLHENRGGVETEYTPDPLGNLIQCRDSAGTKTYEAHYWPYGEVRSETGTNPSPWGFVGLLGYLRDAATLLYVRARYYRPILSRWQTVDPLWPKESAYGYVRLRPTQLIDVTGLGSIKIHRCGPEFGDIQGYFDKICSFFRWCTQDISCRKQYDTCYSGSGAGDHSGCLWGWCDPNSKTTYNADVTCGSQYYCCWLSFFNEGGIGPCAKTGRVEWAGRCGIFLCDRAFNDPTCRGVLATLLHEMHHCSGCNLTDRGEQANQVETCLKQLMDYYEGKY